MRKTTLFIVLSLICPCLLAQNYSNVDLGGIFDEFKVLNAPETNKLLLKKGDRLAICGDSITEQKMYSLIMETYLTVCEPDLDVSIRQYGWGGETASGFLGRMKNDCLRFDPTIATTCYGMNDHRYVPYTDEIGKNYHDNMLAVVKLFKEHGTKVVLGSPGCVGKKPWWQGDPKITTKALNLNLLNLRNMDIEIAAQQNISFADVYMPLFLSMFKAQNLYGSDFHVAGDDGVHPDWAGHLIMAYAFLDALGLDGEIGTITVDLKGNKASAGDGHKIESVDDGVVTITSSRYPFCDKGAPDVHGSSRAGMTLVPFNEELNRLILKVKNTSASNYKIAWGQWEKTYTADQLKSGINLAADFVENPFSKPFEAVTDAIRKKQDYETKQIKSLFHGPEGEADMDAVIELSEKARKQFVENVTKSFQPVKHTISISAVE